MKWINIAVLFLAPSAAMADTCQLNINATDLMRFEQQTLQVEPQCTAVEVTLHHIGKLAANAMGHDWVLTKSADIAAVANAGLSAGLANSFQKPGDTRILASTKIIGGGESSTGNQLQLLLLGAGAFQRHERTPHRWLSDSILGGEKLRICG